MLPEEGEEGMLKSAECGEGIGEHAEIVSDIYPASASQLLQIPSERFSSKDGF